MDTVQAAQGLPSCPTCLSLGFASEASRSSCVRFEDDFSTDNGPDLYAVVYVGGERLELGVLKGNQGAQNYEVPPDVDPASIEAVAVWCKRFDSTFTTATLGPV